MFGAPSDALLSSSRKDKKSASEKLLKNEEEVSSNAKSCQKRVTANYPLLVITQFCNLPLKINRIGVSSSSSKELKIL